MNFRQALLRLQADEGSLNRIIAGFDAREAALCLGIRVKETSNLLRRLRSMGFLKRRKAKRLCVPLNGRACYRGYKYIYAFSRQGVSYLRWLRETMPLEDMSYAQLTLDIVSSLPEELRDRLTLLSLYRSTLRYHGPARHFHFFDNNTVPVISLCIKSQQLAEENKKLLIKNALLKGELDQVRRGGEVSQQREKTLVHLSAAALVEASKTKNEMKYWKARTEEHVAALQVAKNIIAETRVFSEKILERYRALAQS